MPVTYEWPGLASPSDNNVDMPIMDKTAISRSGERTVNGVKTFDYDFTASTEPGNTKIFSSFQLLGGTYPMKRLVLGHNIPNIRVDDELGYDVSDPKHSQIQIVATIPASFWMTPEVLKSMLLNTVGLTFGTITSGDPAVTYLRKWIAGSQLYG
jgi:hypothetical protein